MGKELVHPSVARVNAIIEELGLFGQVLVSIPLLLLGESLAVVDFK